jgi:hypothetical protein
MSNKPVNRTPVPATMWAAIINGKRSAWIQPHAVRRTRREARAAYLNMWDNKYHKQALKHVRFARVIVSEAPNE